MSTDTHQERPVGKAAARIIRAMMSSTSEPAANAWHVTEGGLLIGYDKQEVRIPWPDGNGGKLILIFGKRGTGKTELLRCIQQAAITMGHGVFTINGKYDLSLSRGSTLAAERINKQIRRWSKNGPNSYNPYAHGESLEITDQLLAGEALGTHPHYLRKAQRLLGHLVRALLAAEKEVSLEAVIEHFDGGRLGQLLQESASTDATKASQRYLKQLNEKQWEELSGTRDRLAIIAESEAGKWWKSGPDSIDLSEAAENHELLDFLIDGDGVPLLAQMMSTAIVLDLNKLMASRNKMIEEGQQLEHMFVFIDEFGGIPADLSSIAARGRSAKVTLVLSTQDLFSDTAMYVGLRDRLLANYDALISFREQSPASAETVSRLGGKIEMEISSWDENGHKRTAMEEMYRLAESQVMDLPDYHGAVFLPGRREQERVRLVRMLSPEQIAALRYA